MDSVSVVIVATAVVLFAVFSRRLETSVLTPPLLFTIFGLAAGADGLGLLHLSVNDGAIHLVAELTLILVLFGDASRIDLRALRKEHGLPVRLLAIGMPLTILLGGLVAFALFSGLGLWEALLLGAILAPTDAALGQAVVSAKIVPQRIRQALNVESGLNDGIAVPIVLILLAVAGSEMDATRTATDWIVFATKQVTLGPAAGFGVGLAGAWVLIRGKRSEWFSESLEPLIGLAFAVLAFCLAEAIGGNGFISAFVAGLTVGNVARDVCSTIYEFIEAEGQLLMLIVFLLLGTTMAWPALSETTPLMVLYAALSLTVIRMIPVTIALTGSGARAPTVAFLGWFGPRGLASILFVIVVIEEGMLANASTVINVVVLTVLASIVAHGVTASPGARLYGNFINRNPDRCKVEMVEVPEHPLRLRS